MINITNQTFCQSRIVTLFLLFFSLSFNAFAIEIGGVKFNENYLDHGIKMSLQGTGLKTMFLFKAFAAGFYKGPGNDSDLLGNYPKRIEVEYFVNIPGDKLNTFTIATMKNNIAKTDLKSIGEEIKQMQQYFVDLKPGDRFSLTYIPGEGTKFALNDHVIGIIEGLDFSRALFSVWIGKRPFDNQLKEQVLGLNKGES